MSAVSRSWFTDDGREHIRRLLMWRAFVLLRRAEKSSERTKLVTLTCARVEDWERAQGELRGFLNALRTHFGRRGARISYLWTMELQKRGAVHYHLVLVGCPFIDRKLIAEWWKLGSIFDVRQADVGDALRYTLKYVRKGLEADSDGRMVTMLTLSSAQGMRRHGCSRDVSADTRRVPGWVREICELEGWDPAAVQWRREGDYGHVVCGSEELVVSLADGRWVIIGGMGTLGDDGVIGYEVPTLRRFPGIPGDLL